MKASKKPTKKPGKVSAAFRAKLPANCPGQMGQVEEDGEDDIVKADNGVANNSSLKGTTHQHATV
jgi:hypothetical protein